MNKRNRKKYIIRRRIAMMILIIITMFTAAFAFNSLSAAANKSRSSYTIVVSNGDTLWDIASKANTTASDVRRVVDDIMKLNGLRSASLCVGDRLLIPVY